MSATIRRYGLDRAVGDAYAAEFTRESFATHGIEYERSTTSQWHEGLQRMKKITKPRSILYAELLPRLHSGEVELLDDETLIVQLSSLQRRTRSGARDSIDHPPGGHDDVANAVAGCVDVVMQRPLIMLSVGLDSTPSRHTPGSGVARAYREFERNQREFDKEQEMLRENDSEDERFYDACHEQLFRK